MPKMKAAPAAEMKNFDRVLRNADRKRQPKPGSIEGLARLADAAQENETALTRLEEMMRDAVLEDNAAFFQRLYLAMSGRFKPKRGIVHMAFDAWDWYTHGDPEREREPVTPTWRDIRAWINKQRGTKMAQSKWQDVKKDPDLVALMSL
jgi:hypothetical protein